MKDEYLNEGYLIVLQLFTAKGDRAWKYPCQNWKPRNYVVAWKTSKSLRATQFCCRNSLPKVSDQKKTSLSRLRTRKLCHSMTDEQLLESHLFVLQSLTAKGVRPWKHTFQNWKTRNYVVAWKISNHWEPLNCAAGIHCQRCQTRKISLPKLKNQKLRRSLKDE